MSKYVYAFAEGNKDLKDLLGGKGANLAEMAGMGLPVPPGFIVSTEACRVFLDSGVVPAELNAQVDEHLAALEADMGKTLGAADDPLLVAVRSGSKFSMPGMMETVLDVGLNDSSVIGLTKAADDERFAWDSYRRLIQMFGKTVLGIDGGHFDEAFDAVKKARGAVSDLDLDACGSAAGRGSYKGVVRTHAGREFPQDPREQLDLAINAVFESWNSSRAKLYRRREHIPDSLGTAVNVMAMVFGNLGPDSGSGVAFTRDPATGERGIYGDYLPNAQGEDVVAGIRNTMSLAQLEQLDAPSFHRLMEIMATLEHRYQRHVRHRVHDRARAAVDAADPRGQADRGRGVRGGVPARRRGPDRHGRGPAPGDRRTARPPDVPEVRRRLRRDRARHRHERLPRCREWCRRLRQHDRRGAGRQGREGHPRPPRDEPGRPEGHDRRSGHPDQPRWPHQPRRRRRPRNGQDLRVRGRGAAGRRREQDADGAGRDSGRRGRHALDRRRHRRGVPRRGARRAVAGRRVLRGHRGPGGRGCERPAARRAPDHQPRRRAAAAAGARQRRHR